MSKTSKSKQVRPPAESHEKAPRDDGAAAAARPFIIGVFAFAGILALWALLSVAGGDAGTARLASAGWGRLAAAIVRNRNTALLQAFFMTLCAAVFLWLLPGGKIRGARAGAALLWCVVLLVACDAFKLSRHYVQTMPASLVKENDLIRILKSEQEQKRVALVTQQGFYNTLLTYTFPFHGVKSINITQMPRMREDYSNFLKSLGQNSVRMWQLCSVGYIVAPAQIVPQIGNNPDLKDSFDLVFSFNVLPEGKGGMKIVPGNQQQPGEHVILRSRLESPRYSLATAWIVADDATALKNLASDDFPLFRKVIIAPESAAALGTTPLNPDKAAAGSVVLREYRPGRVVLNVSTDRSAILRIADKYDPDWRAYINGKPTSVLRVDYIFQGVYVEPGLHEVVLRYAPSTWTLWLQALCLLACAAAAVRIFLKRYNPAKPQPPAGGSNG